MNLKGSVRLPILGKVSKKLLLLAAIALIEYFYYRKQNQAQDTAQLVIGAPKPGQISITNPAPVTSHPISKVKSFKKPLSNPSAVRKPKPTGPAITAGIIKHVNQFGTWYTNVVGQQVDEFGHALTHPGSKTIREQDVHNPKEGIPDLIVENLGGALKGVNRVSGIL